MGRKYVILLIGFFGLMIALLIFGRFSGTLQFFTMPSTSMEPALSMNQQFATTNLKDPKRHDIIIFTRKVNENYQTDSSGKNMRFCSRLLAVAGDTIQIINGFALVNGVRVDDTTSLKFNYKLAARDFNNILTALDIDAEDESAAQNFYIVADSAYACLTHQQYERIKNVIRVNRLVMDDIIAHPGVYPVNNWTIDNFGPYLVPPGFCFVVGDNRHNSLDSRIAGPIPIKDVKGILLWKL